MRKLCIYIMLSTAPIEKGYLAMSRLHVSPPSCHQLIFFRPEIDQQKDKILPGCIIHKTYISVAIKSICSFSISEAVAVLQGHRMTHFT